MTTPNIRSLLSKQKVDVAQALGGIEVPGTVISATITTARLVGQGNIVRLTVAAAVVPAAIYVAFGDSTLAAPSGAAGENSILLSGNDSAVNSESKVFYILATGDYIRASAIVNHAEVIEV